MKNQKPLLPQNLLCFSHLRWDFVYQRPQHLLSRFASEMNVYFLEEPVFEEIENDYLAADERTETLTILTPHLSAGSDPRQILRSMKQLVGGFLSREDLEDWLFWYYTPMALPYTAAYKPALIVYDCMDELSAFDFAPKELVLLEKELLRIADVVFTGGYSLFEAKKDQHNNIFPFPSSIDKAHFSVARAKTAQPQDQAGITGVKLGFFGVIDERFQTELIGYIAQQRPDWQIILLGPVLKIPVDVLPRHANIHYLGQKTYDELPAYLAGWDAALIPFKLNDSTRYISPTKTPEYLAAGVRVISTPIRDVVKPYGIEKLVSIAAEPAEFVQAIERELQLTDRRAWLSRVDDFLKDKSWDHTFLAMKEQMQIALGQSGTLMAS
ncbi:glycosyltransferase [Pedobacter sp. SYP-B3415]|uniref:glycosyltransferase n=1 Tax=Pedobacter sp. SYP-B3415 TaxID=2496641 RepID=UPI00101C6D2B|nr:glycosyltransferase [Pedobacter sp. SYP-B3415]